MYNDGIRQYQETSIRSIGPERLIVMLYEGVVRRLEAARAAIADGDISSRCSNLQNAQDIINELDRSLDHDVGGEIAVNLSAVYGFIKRELTDGQITGEVVHIDNVVRVVKPLLEAWQAIKPGTAERVKANPAADGTEDGPDYAITTKKDDKVTEDICAAV